MGILGQQKSSGSVVAFEGHPVSGKVEQQAIVSAGGWSCSGNHL
jgi:hypothetical protein